MLDRSRGHAPLPGGLAPARPRGRDFAARRRARSRRACMPAARRPEPPQGDPSRPRPGRSVSARTSSSGSAPTAPRRCCSRYGSPSARPGVDRVGPGRGAPRVGHPARGV